jgi:hypothetical protein
MAHDYYGLFTNANQTTTQWQHNCLLVKCLKKEPRCAHFCCSLVPKFYGADITVQLAAHALPTATMENNMF